jgi:hypothetical protein
MLTIHECGDQSPPLNKDEVYSLAFVSCRIDDIEAWISLFREELLLEQFLLFWYKDLVT